MDIGTLATIIGCDGKELFKAADLMYPNADPEALSYEECFFLAIHFLKDGDRTDED